MASDTVTVIMDIGSDGSSILFFVIWVVQLGRSGYYHYSYGKESGYKIAFIHAILFVANILYLKYEFDFTDRNPIWLLYSMYFFVLGFFSGSGMIIVGLNGKIFSSDRVKNI